MFSQVPREVLNRIRPIGETRKRIRFCEPVRCPEPTQEEVIVFDDFSSSFSDNDSPPRQVSPRPTSPRPVSPILAEKKTADAILQVQPTMVNHETQTDDSYFQSFEGSIRQLQQSSLMLVPMYNTIQSKGNQPPLKIGLSGVKRKKRRVFYPDQENDDE